MDRVEAADQYATEAVQIDKIDTDKMQEWADNFYKYNNGWKKYNDININMSGNGFISDDEVIFENYMNLSDCNGTQIFKYSIQSNQLYLLPDADKCFNKELEIIEKTTIMIAHCLLTIRNADIIAIL